MMPRMIMLLVLLMMVTAMTMMLVLLMPLVVLLMNGAVGDDTADDYDLGNAVDESAHDALDDATVC